MSIFFNTGIYGGYDEPMIVYVDRLVPVEKRVGGGGGSVQYVDKIIYKDRPFPKLKIIKIDSKNAKRIKIRLFRILYEE